MSSLNEKFLFNKHQDKIEINVRIATATIIRNAILMLGIAPSIIAGLHLIYQFNRKLFQLMFDQTEMSMSNSENVLSNRQIQLLSILTKHTVLGIVQLFLVIFLSILSIIWLITLVLL